MRVRDLAALLSAPFEGDGDLEITGAAPVESAAPHHLSFVSGRKAAELVRQSAAGCLIVPLDFRNAPVRTVIRAAAPRTTLAAALAHLYPQPEPAPGVHETALVAPDAEIAPSASIGPYVTIGSQTRIGPRCSIAAGCTVGNRVTIGEGSRLYANVNIYDAVAIGARAILHSGCVLGADGFGFVLAVDHYEKFPQVGTVILEDDVEIGANSCVDRAALGVTFIGQGTKLDNMVHIGHNCRIGKHVVVAAQTGLSGGVAIDDYAVIGGQVGIGDKARVEARAIVGSGAGILSSKIIRRGQTVWGTPARPLREHLEQLAHVARLPSMHKELQELRSRLAELEARAARE